MNKKKRKEIEELVKSIRLNLNHVENQLSKGLSIHKQRVTEMECDVRKMDKILWKIEETRMQF